LNCCQFCPNSTNTVLAAGGSQMKMFTLDDYSELFEVKADEGEAFYSCDSSISNNKYAVGGKHGSLFYLTSNKLSD
jgi:hypothetical protein